MPKFKIEWHSRTHKMTDGTARILEIPSPCHMTLHAETVEDAESYFRRTFLDYPGSLNTMTSIKEATSA